MSYKENAFRAFKQFVEKLARLAVFTSDKNLVTFDIESSEDFPSPREQRLILSKLEEDFAVIKIEKSTIKSTILTPVFLSYMEGKSYDRFFIKLLEPKFADFCELLEKQGISVFETYKCKPIEIVDISEKEDIESTNYKVLTLENDQSFPAVEELLWLMDDIKTASKDLKKLKDVEIGVNWIVPESPWNNPKDKWACIRILLEGEVLKSKKASKTEASVLGEKKILLSVNQSSFEELYSLLEKENSQSDLISLSKAQSKPASLLFATPEARKEFSSDENEAGKKEIEEWYKYCSEKDEPSHLLRGITEYTQSILQNDFLSSVAAESLLIDEESAFKNYVSLYAKVDDELKQLLIEVKQILGDEKIDSEIIKKAVSDINNYSIGSLLSSMSCEDFYSRHLLEMLREMKILGLKERIKHLVEIDERVEGGYIRSIKMPLLAELEKESSVVKLKYQEEAWGSWIMLRFIYSAIRCEPLEVPRILQEKVRVIFGNGYLWESTIVNSLAKGERTQFSQAMGVQYNDIKPHLMKLHHHLVKKINAAKNKKALPSPKKAKQIPQSDRFTLFVGDIKMDPKTLDTVLGDRTIEFDAIKDSNERIAVVCIRALLERKHDGYNKHESLSKATSRFANGKMRRYKKSNKPNKYGVEVLSKARKLIEKHSKFCEIRKQDKPIRISLVD